MVHIPFLIFSLSYLRPIHCLKIKKDCSYRNNCGIRLHDGGLEHSLMKKKIFMFLISFLCSAIPDLHLGILKMLIRVCFQDVLQAAVY